MTKTTKTSGRVPEIPQVYEEPTETIGLVPAECPAGFEVTRIPHTAEGMATAKTRGQVVVRAGDRNPDNPDELLIANEAIFDKTPEGMLSYRGDLLVVWRTSYADAFRARNARKAHAAQTNANFRRVPLEQGMVAPSEAVLQSTARANVVTVAEKKR